MFSSKVHKAPPRVATAQPPSKPSLPSQRTTQATVSSLNNRTASSTATKATNNNSNNKARTASSSSSSKQRDEILSKEVKVSLQGYQHQLLHAEGKSKKTTNNNQQNQGGRRARDDEWEDANPQISSMLLDDEEDEGRKTGRQEELDETLQEDAHNPHEVIQQMVLQSGVSAADVNELTTKEKKKN